MKYSTFFKLVSRMGAEACEKFLLFYTWLEKGPPDLADRSSPAGGRPFMIKNAI